jgi:hypothetical protein
MALSKGGPCAVDGCEVRAGYGPGHMFCPDHAAATQRRIGELLRHHPRVRVHEGDPVVLPCGHAVTAGDLVAGGPRWRCAACAERDRDTTGKPGEAG